MRTDYKEKAQTLDFVEKIIKACDDYDKIFCAMDEYFTRITDMQSNRFEEFNKKFPLNEIANCKVLTTKPIKISKAKGINGKFTVHPEIYLYDKAPKGMIIMLSLHNKQIDKRLPVGVDLYIKEN